MVTVAVDANGADLGAAEVLAGAVAAVQADAELRVLLFAPAMVSPHARVEVIDAPVSIAKEPDPARAVRSVKDASIVRAWAAVASGEADALVSGGSTGAALAAGLFGVKRARGVYRPALAIQVPAPDTPFLLLDAGANVSVRPEHLVQFAHMGAAFSRAVLGVREPRVALLSNGTEPGKGTEEIIAAHEALRSMPGFVGNVEGFTVAAGDADVVVTDGFTGNVMVKTMEGTSKAVLDAVRAAAMSSARAKAGGLLLKPSLGGLRAAIDPELAGGAFLLGLRGLGVVPHGSFTRRGFEAAIALAARGVREDVAGTTHAALEAAGALRRAPEPSAEGATLPPR
jgi:glycerol-3-phosphate acyltransferase PlsX